MKKISASLFLLLLLTAASGVRAQCEGPKRIAFQRGATTAIIKGAVSVRKAVCYQLSARAGQRRFHHPHRPAHRRGSAAARVARKPHSRRKPGPTVQRSPKRTSGSRLSPGTRFFLGLSVNNITAPFGPRACGRVGRVRKIGVKLRRFDSFPS